MAAIGTIRKYSGLAVGLIGVSILAFVISDAFQSNTGFGGKDKMIVGEIDGESISYQEFVARIDQEVEKYKARNQVEEVEQGTRDQIREELWQKIQEEIIYDKEYEYTGISFSSEELTYFVSGPNPHQAVQQFFRNQETNEFDRSQLVGFLKNMDEYPEYKEIWLDFESELGKERKRTKYFNLVKAGLHISDLEARDAYYSKNQFATFEYISLPLREIPDSTVSVTEAEIKKYYNKHKEDNQIDESRSLEFVSWEVIPSKEDSLALFDQLARLKKEFKATTRDSMFVEVHSDEHFDTLYHNPGSFTDAVDYAFLVLKQDDTIIGPYYDKNMYKIAKLIDRKTDTSWSYRASHILIKPTGSTDQDTLDAMAKARDLMAKAKAGDDFEMLAMRNSEDKQSAIKGGDLGWFKEGAMVQPFMDAVKKLGKGQYTVVKSQFGAHLIYITENPSNTLLKVGVIAKKIDPSSDTYKAVYAKAVKFKTRAIDDESYQNSVNEMELNKMLAPELRPGEREVPGLPNGGALISWAYRAKKGEVSDIFDLTQMYVVAIISEVNEKGPAPLEKIYEEVKQKVIKEKKQQMLYDKLVEAGKSAKSLEKIAEATKTKVDKITNASFDMPFITGIGEEKLLIGYVFGSEKEKLSAPIIGENAVFQFVLRDFSKVEESTDLSQIKKEKVSNLQGMSQFETMESLKELAKIEDWRYRFF